MLQSYCTSTQLILLITRVCIKMFHAEANEYIFNVDLNNTTKWLIFYSQPTKIVFFNQKLTPKVNFPI